MGFFFIQQYANGNIEFETHKNEICFKTLESSAFQLSFEYRMLYLQIKNAVEYCTSIWNCILTVKWNVQQDYIIGHGINFEN